MSAIRQSDGRVSGSFSIFYPATGGRVFGRVTCFTIVGGKSAWIAGVVEGSNDTTALGQEYGWRAVDNGPPDGGVPDQLSLADPLAQDTLGTAQDFCTKSEEHTSELQSPCNLVCRLLLEKKKRKFVRSKRICLSDVFYLCSTLIHL